MGVLAAWYGMVAAGMFGLAVASRRRPKNRRYFLILAAAFSAMAVFYAVGAAVAR